jgi:hypothetical protein
VPEVVVVAGSVSGFAALGIGSAEERRADGRSGKDTGGCLSIRAGAGLTDGFVLGADR